MKSFDFVVVVVERRIQQHIQRISQNIRSFSKDVRHLKPDLASKTSNDSISRFDHFRFSGE